MSKASLTNRLRPSLPDLDFIANKTSLVVRKSTKFDPGAFLQTLLSSVVTGHASLNQLVGALKDRVAAPMARQSLHERIGKQSTAFLIHILCHLMEQRYEPTASALRDGPILRVIIEDSTSQLMLKSNAKTFPGNGNNSGPTAGVKIDLTYDLLTGVITNHSIQLATEQDKTIGREIICEVRQGDLVLRDLGYFSLGEFRAIEERGAWWLTRLPLTTGVMLEQGGTLEKYLKRCRGDIHELGAIVGAEGKKCRLVAIRAAPTVAAARRAQRRKKAQKSGKTPSPAGLIRDGWHLILTNLTKDQADADGLPRSTAPVGPWKSSFGHGNKRSTLARPSTARATSITFKHWYWRR